MFGPIMLPWLMPTEFKFVENATQVVPEFKKVKSVEYHENGTIKRIEYFEDSK